MLVKRHALNPSREHSHLPLSTTKLVSNAMEQLVSDHYLVKGSAALSFDKGVHEGIKEAREKSGVRNHFRNDVKGLIADLCTF